MRREQRGRGRKVAVEGEKGAEGDRAENGWRGRKKKGADQGSSERSEIEERREKRARDLGREGREEEGRMSK